MNKLLISPHRRASETNSITAMEWTANVFLWVGGAMLAISPDLAGKSWVLFLALFVGQGLWGVSAYLMRKWSLLASSVFFGLFNIYGMFVRF